MTPEQEQALGEIEKRQAIRREISLNPLSSDYRDMPLPSATNDCSTLLSIVKELKEKLAEAERHCRIYEENSARERANTESAESALAQLKEGWRPIETAPKDGTRVDLWVPPYGRIVNCLWDVAANRWVARGEPDEEGCDEIAFGPRPTHWREIPAPPQSETTT